MVVKDAGNVTFSKFVQSSKQKEGISLIFVADKSSVFNAAHRLNAVRSSVSTDEGKSNFAKPLHSLNA